MSSFYIIFSLDIKAKQDYGLRDKTLWTYRKDQSSMNGEHVFSYFLQEAGFDEKQMRRLSRLRDAVIRGQGIKEVREENWREFGIYLIAQGKIRRETLVIQEGLEIDERGNIKTVLRKENDTFPERKRRDF